ncbi:MAG: adenine phosphoribosyltransferase, partial [Chthonomonadales bacterium]
MSELKAASLIRDIPDFPKPGILFKDITPVLADPDAMKEVINKFAEFAADVKPDIIVGIESRGFVLGMPLALQLHLQHGLVRPAGPQIDGVDGVAWRLDTYKRQRNLDILRPNLV